VIEDPLNGEVGHHGPSELAQHIGELFLTEHTRLYLGAGALVNTLMLLTGEDYADFADGSYIPFVHHTWRSLVVPNHHVFISLLVAFEAAVGLLALAGGRKAQLGLVAAMAFHVALLSFGWGFYLWSIPMLAALGQLLVTRRFSCRGRRS
jgi:hypothetical protein